MKMVKVVENYLRFSYFLQQLEPFHWAPPISNINTHLLELHFSDFSVLLPKDRGQQVGPPSFWKARGEKTQTQRQKLSFWSVVVRKKRSFFPLCLRDPYF